jgi:hypothetical protein
MYDLYRCQLVEFGEKVLGLKAVDIINTPAYDLEFQEAAEVSDNLFRAKVLAYSTSTWKGYASSIKGFLQFCATREKDNGCTWRGIVPLSEMLTC